MIELRSVVALGISPFALLRHTAEAARRLVETDELKTRPRKSLTELVANFERWRSLIDGLPHTELAETVLEDSGYVAMLQADKSPEAPGRLENLKELINALQEFENLAGFLEHVALVMDNRPEFLTLFTALSRVGAVTALINTQLRGAGLEHALAVSRAKLVIAGSEHAAPVLAAAAPLPGFVPDKHFVVQGDPAGEAPTALRSLDQEVAAGAAGAPVIDHPGRMSELCCYVYTSGTTGLPKACGTLARTVSRAR